MCIALLMSLGHSVCVIYVSFIPCFYSTPDRWAEYCDELVCLCLCVCVCACSRSYLWITRPIFTKFFVHVTCGCGSILLWQCSDTLRISGFVDYVIFAHLLIACSMSPAGWGSEAHTYAALGLLHKNTRCRQQMLRINFCSQCLIGTGQRAVKRVCVCVCVCVGVLNIYDIMLALNVLASRPW